MWSRFKKKPVLVLLSLAFLLVWFATGFVAIHRTLDGSNDFDTFYEAGRSVLKGTSVYYVGEYYQVREGIGPFLYPPIAACFFALFALLPMPAAAFLWNSFLLVLFAGALGLTLRFLGVSYPDLSSIWKAVPGRDKLLFPLVGVVVLLDNLAMAQINIFVFFLCVLALVLWERKKDFTAGLVLASAVLIKLTPIFFCLYFLVKRAWRLLAGVLAGGLILSLLIPTLVFGWGKSRIYHQQWFGRMIKPMVIEVIAKFQKFEPHPLKKSPEEIRELHISQMLVDTNQSLEAGLMRLFLKNRTDYQVAHRYAGLPVLGGGIPQGALSGVIQIFRVGLLMVLIVLCLPGGKGEPRIRRALEISLVFLSTTLLSPIARSHYYIVWIFAYLTLYLMWFAGKEFRQGAMSLSRAAARASLFYFALALPYAEAVGMGAWANLIFWLGCANALRMLGKQV